MEQKLYLVHTFDCGQYYVEAGDQKEAAEKLSHYLEKNHIGFTCGNEIESITTIAKEGRVPKNAWEKGPEILIK